MKISHQPKLPSTMTKPTLVSLLCCAIFVCLFSVLQCANKKPKDDYMDKHRKRVHQMGHPYEAPKPKTTTKLDKSK